MPESASASREPLFEALRHVGMMPDEAIDIGEAGLLLAAVDRPTVDLAVYRQHLADLTVQARQLTRRQDSVAQQVEALRQVLAGRHGYVGDAATYDDMRNANLIEVIDRRRGLPVALGILYLHTARGFAGDIVGLSFPSHFLVRIASRGQRVILDPFAGGRTMAAEDLRRRLKELHGADAEIHLSHFQAVGNRDILLRLQNNIKLRSVGSGDVPRALAILETMRLLAPDRSELCWEEAVLHSKVGNLRMAIVTLEQFLAEAPASAEVSEIEGLLRRLRGRIN